MSQARAKAFLHKTSPASVTACMVSIISSMLTERKLAHRGLHKALQRSCSAEIQTQVSLTPNPVLFPPNCTVKTKETENHSMTWASPWLITSIPQAHVLVSQGSGLKEHPAWDGGPPANE